MLLFEDHDTIVTALAFSRDGSLLASGSRNGLIVIRDDLGNTTPIGSPKAESIPVHSLGFRPDNTLLAGFDSGWLSIPPGERPAPEKFVLTSLTGFSLLTANRLAMGHGERMTTAPGLFLLFDLETKRAVQPTFREAQGVKAVAGCPAKNLLAWSTGRLELKVWDIRKQSPLVFRLSHSCTSLALAPDGSAIAAAQDWSVRVIDLGTKMDRAVLKGHKGIVSCVAFSPDGSTIATGSWDETVRLWDAATGRERATFQWPVGKVFSLAYAPDGQRLAVGGDRGAVLVWDVE